MRESAAPAPDTLAREAALDPTRSFIVQAPAGSGKTTLLTQRYLALLARVRRPEAVLAITFTRKAAAEMRERVLESLDRALAGVAPKHAADARTLKLAGAALAHAAALGWNLREQPARLRIQTIDSLNAWLAGRLPILSGAGSTLKVLEQPEELYALAAERTVAEIERGGELAEALAVVLRHFDNDVAKLEELLGEMLALRDRWLRLVAPGTASGEDLRAALEDALGYLLRMPLAHAQAILPVSAWSALGPLAARAAARLGPAGRLAALIDAPWPYETDAGGLECWRALATLLLTEAGGWRRRVDVRIGFPPAAADDKAAFASVVAELSAHEALLPALAAIQQLPPARYDADSAAMVDALYTVLIEAAARLAAVFAEQGRVDFGAISQAALDALGLPDEPSELTLELDYRIEHVLVDEFQDTSAPQVSLLERLTAGWQAGDGRTLFLVGDPMQSVYLFREADVGLFLKIRREGLGSIALVPLALEANFRSRPGLVDWFNATFARVLPAQEDYARGAVSYAPAQAVRAAGEGPAVTLALLPGATVADEAARVVEIIARERARDPAVKIAVLGRARGHLTQVAAALLAAGVSHQGVDLVPLAERPAVRDLVVLTRALLHLADRVAWLACLRAPWCGLEFDALERLAREGAGRAIWEAMQDPACLAALAPPQLARLARVTAVFAAALADRGRRPLAALVESTWFALGGPATLGDAADLENARVYFGRLDELERAGDLDDPAALETRIGKLYAAPDPRADESLQLLTIHKAKGLEWPVVILTGLGRTTRATGQRLLEWLEYTRPDDGPRLVLAPHPARARGEDPLHDWLRSLAREREALELGRLGYVAATRAMERLYLVAHAGLAEGEEAATLPGPRPGSLLATLWPALADALRAAAAREPVTTAAVAGTDRPRNAPLLRLADDWTPPAVADGGGAFAEPTLPAGPSEFEFEWVTASARHVGTVVHEELERIAARGLALDALLAGREAPRRHRLLELGVGPAQVEAALARVGFALAATAADARGAWLFDPAHVESASEFGLSTIVDGRLLEARIDRTFIDADGVRWIVDYKTSQHEGADVEAFLDRERLRYTTQLERYATLVAAREPGRPIRLGLYFPLLGGWREWAPGEPPGAS